MSQIKPLNPDLYLMLRRHFGRVRIANEGKRAVTKAVPDLFTNKLKYRDEQKGEEYRVCCPKCGDKRFRLYINYRWRTVSNIPTNHLIHCFNENCHTQFMDDEIKPYIGGKISIPELGFEPAPKMKEITLPGKCVPLNSLPDTHLAVKYVLKRRFTPGYLFDEWGVQFCTEHASPLIRDRLIIPFYWENKLVGWQARMTSDPHKDGPPKYYTMPGLQKGQMLFNGDRARYHKMGVIVEGVFDVFRVGTQAVALLGTSVSMIQRQLIHAYWGDGCVCLMLDSDAVDEMVKATNMFTASAFKLGIFSVTLPDGKDPADMPRKALWKEIAANASACHIPIAG